MPIKWPEKKEMVGERTALAFQFGWNACLDACRKAVEQEPKPIEDCLSCGCKKYCFEQCACGYPRGLDKQSPPLVALDEKELRHYIHAICLKDSHFGILNGDEADVLANKICSTFGVPPVLSVEVIGEIIENTWNDWDKRKEYTKGKSRKELIAEAIHAKLYGGTK